MYFLSQYPRFNTQYLRSSRRAEDQIDDRINQQVRAT